MHRTLPYIGLFVLVTLLQVFLFNNLTISVAMSPLIYVTFIFLLPIETKPISMLLWGVVMGVTMDLTMGTAGINTIATLFVAHFRALMLTVICGRDTARDGGIPSVERLGANHFFRYLLFFVFIHHLIFFSLESLSTTYLLRVVWRFAVSFATTMTFVWILSRLFSTKLPSKL